MEIITNFWQVLITENEFMTTILNSPTVILELWLLFRLATGILELNYTKKQMLIYVILLSLTSLLTEFFIAEPFNILLNYVIMFIVIKIVLKTNIIKTILSIIIPSTIFAITGIIILKPFLLIFKVTSYQIQTVPIYQFIYLLFTYSILFILVNYISLKKIKITLDEDFSKKNKKIVLINIIFAFFTLCLQLIITSFYTDILPLSLSLLSLVPFFSYLIFSFYSLTRILKLQIATRNLQYAENYNATLTYLYDNVKSFHHDFDNMLFIIGGYINENDIEGLKSYYKRLEKDSEKVNNIALLNPKLINNPGIYNLLVSKYKKASNACVDIKLDFFFDFNKLNMPIYEFSRVLGILLDNAIEAAESSLNKQVFISFRDSTYNNIQIIEIKNTYNSENVNFEHIFEKGKSSKENHSGIGLWEVTQILKKINNATLNTSHDDTYFKQTLEIYY